MDSIKKWFYIFLTLGITLSILTILTFFRAVGGFEFPEDENLFMTIRILKYVLLFASISAISVTIVLKTVRTAIQEEIYELRLRIIELEKGNVSNK